MIPGHSYLQLLLLAAWNFTAESRLIFVTHHGSTSNNTASGAEELTKQWMS